MGPIIVAGLGRCGSSLVMQMLQAARVPCLGEFPAFEPESVGSCRIVRELLAKDGIAMKILDPWREQWPASFKARIIWLDRDTTKQAKSQVKFVRLCGGIEIPSQVWRAMRKALRDDRFACVRWWSQCTTEPLFIRFEDILADPLREANRICAFLGLTDPQRMSACVRPRTPKCRPDISLELELIELGQTMAR